MKVNSPSSEILKAERPGVAPADARSRASASVPASVTSPSTSPSAETVQLSAASAQMAGAASQAPVDTQRVSQVRQAIASGEFRVNAEVVADRLIGSQRDQMRA